MKVRFLRPAEEEVLAAHPEIGAPFDEDKRRLLLRRFQHSVIYEVGVDEVIVAAVPHQRPRVRSWRDLS